MGLLGGSVGGYAGGQWTAAGQVFFSISVGFGIIIHYASFLGREDDVALSGLTAAATNEVFEVGFGGLITLTASFVFLGLTGTIAAVSAGTYGLGFQTLPVVFAQMGAIGPWVGAVWFFMLFLAVVTSSLRSTHIGRSLCDTSAGSSSGCFVSNNASITSSIEPSSFTSSPSITASRCLRSRLV